MLGCLLRPCGSHIVGDTQVAIPCDTDPTRSGIGTKGSPVCLITYAPDLLQNTDSSLHWFHGREQRPRIQKLEQLQGPWKNQDSEQKERTASSEKDWRRELMRPAVRRCGDAAICLACHQRHHQCLWTSSPWLNLYCLAPFSKWAWLGHKPRGLKITNIFQVSHWLPECLSPKNYGDKAYKALTWCKGLFCFHVLKHLLPVPNEALPLLLCPPQCSSPVSARPTIVSM